MNSSTSTQTGCLLFQDERFLEHRTGAHPEKPARLESVLQHLNETLLAENSPIASAIRLNTNRKKGDLSPQEWTAIHAVHSEEYVKQLERFAAHGGGQWDADTVVSPDSYSVALLAARTAIQATDQVLSGTAPTAFCLLRPPGHHALANQAMGFCLLNNVAIAARYAVQQRGLQRVLIIDWDVHHGNGTQDIFYDDGQVWFFSAHRHPFYPGTGLAAETGRGPGTGATCNLPFAEDASRTEYLQTVTERLTEFARQCQPELIFISAGFDAHRLDPIGSLGLETADFSTLTRLVKQLAGQHCGGKIVSLLEGGYHLQALAESAATHLQELAMA